ncbi:CRE-DSC-1 protein [Caenorhabditis remanei]|uniref:CRE-DSC-1 protein n=1 Tax=Caenorhabditis remanei TaxID=31234 RepID=E3MC98_CAERE|nr:CRE-DSC-1 protein [Caenorhabditis remanei]
MNPNANLNNIFDFPDLPLVLPKIEVPDSSDFLLPSSQELQQFDPPRNLVSQIARRWSCGDSQHAVDEMPASYYHNLGFALHNHIQMSNQRYLSDFNCPSTVSPIPSAHEPGQMPPMTPYDHIGQDPHLFSAYGNSMMPSDGSYFDNGSRSISAPNIGNPGLNTTVMTSGNSQSCANRRRFRTNFTEQQSSFLEDSFKESHYPDHKSKKHMANYLNIPEDRITVWFQNRRAKWRRKEHRQRDRSKNELFTSTPSSFDYSCFPGPNPEEISDVKHPNIYGIPGSQLHDPFQMNPDGSNVEYLHNQGQH